MTETRWFCDRCKKEIDLIAHKGAFGRKMFYVKYASAGSEYNWISDEFQAKTTQILCEKCFNKFKQFMREGN